MNDKRVLVIDDERGVRDAFRLALEDVPRVRIETAENGERGLCSALRWRPDLVFLDLRMPRMDGVQTLRRLRAAEISAPVYIVTAFVRDFLAPLQVVAAEGLAFELATKPLSGAQIREITRRALRLSA